nr:RHS repeat-associated core domain-containing protein [Steroidobacter cummioxidans]
MLPARTLLSRRRHWRNRRRVRRLASGRSIYNYFRDYDPTTGRYVQSDPSGLEGGLNTYRYALNRPTMLIDVDGRLPLSPECPLLRGLVVRTCKEANRRCEYGDSCEELDLKVSRHLACVITQTELSRRCFGWSITHGHRISDSYNGMQRRVRIAEDTGCGWCGPPRPRATR